VDSNDETRAKLLGSLLLFTRTFYKIRTGREFTLSVPLNRECHYITVCRELTKVLRLEVQYLLINMPPGHGKSELLKHFIAWAYAHYPDCAFIYISYGASLAAEHTYDIRNIMQLNEYQDLFSVSIKADSKAKGLFRTNAGGILAARGSEGAITGLDAGLPNLDRFSGGFIMDDMHKPDDGDTTRIRINNNYHTTIKTRKRGTSTCGIFIGQRVHEDDLPANLINGFDGHEWKKIIIPSVDDNGHALAPNIITKEELDIYKETSPYIFYSQYQQQPQPAGGSLFKKEWLQLLNFEPKFDATFIVCDTAETEKTYNDATVFSHFGLHKIIHNGIDSGIYGLYWIDCLEIRVEPKDLQDQFIQFYSKAMRHEVKPRYVAIEKKSTGTTLVSTVSTFPGLITIDVTPQPGAFYTKTGRFINIQSYIASKLISLPLHSNHTDMIIEHMAKITANQTHKHDDIADTLAYGIKLALVDKIIINSSKLQKDADIVSAAFRSNNSQQAQLRGSLWQIPNQRR
jgi:hypothetical protein